MATQENVVGERATRLGTYRIVLNDVGDRPDEVVEVLRKWGWEGGFLNRREVIKLRISRPPVVIEDGDERDGVDQAFVRSLTTAGAKFEVLWD